MASYAKTVIVGNLGRDPETRYLPSGEAVCNFSVAVTESWKDKASGEKKESTVWYRVSAFGKLAEICGQYLKKGSQVLVDGKMQTRKWQDKEGVEKETWELKADNMTMLGGKPEGSSAPAQQERPSSAPQKSSQGAQGGAFDSMSDDIPFRQIGAGRAWRVI